MANDYNLACWEGPGTSLTWRYVSNHRQTTTSGTDFWVSREGSAVSTIVLDGVEWQATCYWGPVGKMVLEVCSNRGSFSRTIYDGKRSMADIGPPSPADDSHQTCHCNFDSLGHIHFAFNHHNTAFNYRVTTLPVNDPSFVGALTTGTTPAVLDSVTYPQLIKDPVDQLWLFTGQGDSTALRDQYLFKLTTPGASPVWTAATGTGTDGIVANGQSNSEGVYFGCPDFSPDWDGAGTGYMAFGATWKLDAGTTTLHDPFYLQYNGTTFSKRGGAQTVPVTPANCETLDASGTGNNFSSGASVTFDSLGRPHMTWLKGATDCAVIHAYHNGTSWVLTTVVTGVGVDAFIMPGTLVCWEDDTISIVIRDESNGHMMAYSSLPGDYTDWSTIDDLTGVDTGTEFTATGFDGVAACPDKWGVRNKHRFEFPLPLAVTKPMLLNGLLFQYDLRDVYESQAQSGGALLLTNVGTATFAAGKIGNAVDLEVGSLQQLTMADGAVPSQTGAMTIAAAVNRESTGADRGVLGKWLITGNQRSYALIYANSTSRYQWFVSGDGTASSNVVANSFGAGSTAAWEGVIVDHDPVADLIGISVNAGTRDTAAHSTNIFDSTALFRIGQGNSTTNLMDGLVDEVAMWNVVLSSDLRTFWYNSGDIRPWNEFGMIAPTIYSHGSTADVDVDAGETVVATVAAYGNIPMTESLTGTDAADFSVTDNGDGTWDIEFDSPATAGTYEFTLTLANDAGSDAVDFTVNVAASGPPENTVAPAVTGAPTEGETLTCSQGTWTGADSYAYQWYTNSSSSSVGGTPIGGATSSTYDLTASEVGDYVYCVVTATNGEGSTDEPSDVEGPIAAAPVAPTITTTANINRPEGQTAVVTMAATGDAPIAWSITGGADAALFSIVEATGVLTFDDAPDYEDPQDADTNNVYVVEVTATNDAGTDGLTLNITVQEVGNGVAQGLSPQFSAMIPGTFSPMNTPLVFMEG